MAQEWSKKNKLKPTEVSVASHKKIIWKCKHGPEWEASVKCRTVNGTGCPYCSHNKVLAGFNDLASQYFGNADAVPQPPERCLSRQAGIVRCCPKYSCTICSIKARSVCWKDLVPAFS
ncbi:MAG: zinc-ribbon domain-containing protein [Subdoligranulum sp.]|nr:zinc-ribbon domain-containing protein [Subdoligranulum sp.]